MQSNQRHKIRFQDIIYLKLNNWRAKVIKSYIFSQASDLAGILNPRIWFANHPHVSGPAFHDTAHGPDFFFAA